MMVGTALLALGLTAACKDDSSAMKQQVTSGAESAGKAGVETGVSAGKEGGVKEGTKEGGKAAATDVVN
jgi:flagellar biosynthesis/type III secretory pathway protein FliH